jgi:hypothetical protein
VSALTSAQSAAVVGDLRKARRKQRVASIHWVDALYQVYVVGLVALIAVVGISGATGDGKVSVATLADVRAHGPAMFGLRSGSRGGPLALEQPDVRHVLLSPVDRGVALRGPAWRQLRFLVAIGLGVGATAGQLALRRLPGNGAEWIIFGALFGMTVVALAFGSALVASGVKLPGWAATIGGGLLVAWSVGNALDRVPQAPGTLVGRIALWPLHAAPIALVGTLVAIGLVAAGMYLVAGTSLEAAERRTALVGQLRFAVTLQDLRTVLVLRRQLAQERARSRPWIPALRHHPRFPVVQRGVRSLARWPVSRIGRVLVLIVVAGASIRGAWGGTTPLVVLAGLVLWVAGLDAVEAMGQEIDHPGRTDAFPIPRGELLLQHLPVVGMVSVVVGVLAGVVASAPIGSPVPVGVALIVGASAGLLAGCGAAVSVVQGAPEAVDTMALITPEIAGMKTVFRTVWPPLMAVAGTLPLLAARAAERGARRPPPVQAALTIAGLLLIVAVLVAAWVRFRDEIKTWFAEVAAQASPTKALERQAEERQAAEVRESQQLAESRRIGGVDDEGGSDDDDRQPARSRQPRPKAKPKPKPGEAPAGVRGGSSAKPIGRKRDLVRDEDDVDGERDDEYEDSEFEADEFDDQEVDGDVEYDEHEEDETGEHDEDDHGATDHG